MEVVNLFADEWDEESEHGGFRSRETVLGNRLGAERIGGTLYEVDPGKKLWPYHLHYANEEWLLVVRGRPTLRTPEGERELVEGDVVAFRRGPEGAHQVINGSDGPVRVLMLSTKVMPEIVEYPDSGKVGTRDAAGERIFLTRAGTPVEYWNGEE